MPDSAPQDHSTVRPVALVVALVLMAWLIVVAVLRQQPPAPKGVDAPPDQFSAGRVLVLLKDILGDSSPHWVGSEQNQAVGQRIVSVFERLGYKVDVQEKMACRHHAGDYTACATVQNIIARLPGREAGPALMLTAHYDSVMTTAGAADDGMAVAIILESARILKAHGPYRNPIVFLLTDGEEVGMLGAEAFVSDHPWARDVAVVLNQEARGNSGPSFMFETSAGNGWLVDAYASAVPRSASSSLHYEIYRVMPNNSDLTVFRAAGMAGMNFAFIDRVAHYHTHLDNVENLNLGSVQHQGDSVLAVAQELAGVDLSSPPPGNAAWADVLGLVVVHWPASWTTPLAVLSLLLILVVAIRLIRRHALTVGGLLLGLLSAFLCLLAAIVLGMVLIWFVSLVKGAPAPYYAYPLPLRVTVWAAALLSGGLIATALGRRAQAWGLAVGAWLLWALLALVLSIVLPGATIMLLLPLFVAGVLFAVVAFSRLFSASLAREAALIVAALGAGVIWLPLVLIFESAVGFGMSPAVTLGLGLIAGTLAPLFALPEGQTQAHRLLLVASAATVMVAAVIAMLVPPFSTFAPQPVIISHFDDRNQGTAYWVVFSTPGDVPEPLRGRLDADPVTVFPWQKAALRVTGTQSTSAAAPDLQVLGEELVSDARVVTAQLRSPRGADSISVYVPVEALASIGVADQTLPVSSAGTWNGYYALQCYGRGCDGLVVQLQFTQAAPVEVLVVDTTYDLPLGGEVLVQARPSTAVPVGANDQTIIMTRIDL